MTKCFALKNKYTVIEYVVNHMQDYASFRKTFSKPLENKILIFNSLPVQHPKEKAYI